MEENIQVVVKEVKQEEQKQPNKNKKLVYGIIAAVVIVVLGIGLYMYNDQHKKQAILDSIQVTFVEDLTIEYGEKDFDLNTLIKDKSDDVITPTNFDSSKLGEQELIYKVDKEGLTKQFTVKVSVTDTKGAEITFKEDAVSLEYGAEFDVAENIESVKDPVDGDVPFAETAGENNYYTIDGSVDTSTAGDYTVTIKAKDKNGIESEKSFTVNVAEEYIAPEAPASTSTGGSYTQPTYQQPSSNGGNSVSNGSGGSAPAPAPTCNMSLPAGAYATAEEAYNAGNKMLIDGTAPAGAFGFTAKIYFNECKDVVGYGQNWEFE